ncbi:quinoprotein dehydrogenase-associated putative ABC transporter substrate-binding protein [Povalibacter sp.]|uniref:quinoprotein dehydrogenase-associated putative ABC transporter substrate-binding protein n=1 Tax=Povalibacter sp. TaxID=1962978 RepID=UPI002F409E53
MGVSRYVLALAGLACITTATAVPSAKDPESVLRVCADPNNLPLSNDRGEGYENRIAEELARDLGRKLEYSFFPQRMGFVRNTLRARDPRTEQFKCDVIIGVPKGYELTATTRPYMKSTYVLLLSGREDFEGMRTAEDLLKLPAEKRRTLRIGVFGRSPGADWLLRNEMMEHAVVYTPQSGDPAETPAHTIEQDLEAGKIDAAILWGPIAGFLSARHAGFPAWRTAPFMPDDAIKFDYEISMGVRFGEKEWKEQLDAWIGAHQDRIDAILTRYRVPLLDANGQLVESTQAADQARAGSVPKTIPLRLEPQ